MSALVLIALAAAGANAATAAWLYWQLSRLRQRVDDTENVAWQARAALTTASPSELPASYRVAAEVDGDEPVENEPFSRLIQHGGNEWLVYDYVENVDMGDVTTRLSEFRLHVGGTWYHFRGEVNFYTIFECPALFVSKLGKFVDRDGGFATEHVTLMNDLVDRWRRRERAKTFWNPTLWEQLDHDEDE